MPADSFLQHFHNLVLADADARSRAALAIKRSLTSATSSGQDSGAQGENLQYALRRLVRGVQSPRQCARQGFSLALAELLVAFPAELAGVIQLVRKETELQAGLKASEQKERLLGRLFAFAALVEAGCLRKLSEPKASKSRQNIIADLGLGLQEIYGARPYLKDPAVHLLAKVCSELGSSGLSSLVPAALGAWALDDKLKDGEEAVDMHAAGLAVELRQVYLDAKEAGASAGDLKAWPACVKEDRLSRFAVNERLAKSLGSVLGANPIGDAVPFALGPVCRWWLRMGVDWQELQGRIWPNLDEALFPERASPILEAQGLRAFSELAAQLHAAAASGSAQHAGVVLTGLFGSMPRGLEILLRTLSWPRAQAHSAAVCAQRKLLEAAGAAAPPAGNQKGKEKKGKGKGAASMASTAPAPVQLGDDARLAILEALQGHRVYGSMPGQYQRQWQQALLAPLSSQGVRSRCEALLKDGTSASAPPTQGGTRSSDARLAPSQTEALALHCRAPDEVILACICRLLTAGYFEQHAGASTGAAFSLRTFLSSANAALPIASGDLLVPVPVGTKDATSAAEIKKHWRAKLWSSLVGLSKRPSPEMAEKIMASSGGGPAPVDDELTEEGGGAGQTVRTFAFNGCLSDGSLLLSRLHQWWDHLVQKSPEVAIASSPRAAAKKRKKEVVMTSAVVRCVAPLSEEDLDLRKKCVDVCHGLLAEAEVEGGMTTRQRNALCSLPLALALVLLDAEDQEDRESLRGQIKEVLPVVSDLPADAPADAPPKKRAKIQKQREEALAAVPRVAAELFVSSGGLVKEVARMAWRELGDFTSEETLSSICASVRDTGDAPGSDGEADGDKEAESDRGETEGDVKKGAKAKRVAKLAQMADEAKAEGEAEAREKAAQGGADAGGGQAGDSEDVDEIVLGGDEVLQQLLGEGDDDAAGSSLLSMFAGSGLEGAEPQEKKLSKRQQRLRQRQEELAHKFRELDLLEVFLARFVCKRPMSLNVLLGLYEAMISAAVRARGGRSSSEASGPKKKSKASSALRQMEDQLSQRIAKLLARGLKQVCRPAVIREVCSWCSPDKWAEHARKLFVLGGSPQAAAAGQRPLAAGSQLLYFACAAHRAALLGDAVASAEAHEGWTLSKDTLEGALRDWGSKKDCEGWCEAVLGAFSSRAPQVLLRLPWLDHIRTNKKVFAQRSQVSFFCERLLRNLPPEIASSAPAAELGSGFATLCTELLEGTLSNVEKDADAKESSASQKAKLRREALRGLAAVLKARKRDISQGGSAIVLDSKKVASVVTRIRDDLPSKRGEANQLCWHVVRTVGRPSSGNDSGGDDENKHGQKRTRSDKGGEQGAPGKKKKGS